MPQPLDFRLLYRDHCAGVHRYALRLSEGSGIDSDDVVQETFLRAWLIQDRRTTDNIRAWLLGIARRVYWFMRRTLMARAEGRCVPWEATQDTRIEPRNPELAIWLDQLQRKFSRLGPAQEKALRGVASGLTPSEIAERDGTSASAVRMALSLGRKRLREGLDAAHDSTKE